MILNRRAIQIISACSSLLLGSCNKAAESPVALEKSAESYQIDDLKGEVAQLKQRISILESADNLLPLKLGGDGFQFVETGAGGGTIEWIGSKDNGNGTALRLKFGNPSAADWNKYTVIGTYGKLDTDGKPVDASAKPFLISASQPIPSGHWKTVTLQLDGPKSQDVGYLRVNGVLIENIGLIPE